MIQHASHFSAHGTAKQAPEDAKAEAEADEGFLVYPAAWRKGRGNTTEANRMEK